MDRGEMLEVVEMTAAAFRDYRERRISSREEIDPSINNAFIALVREILVEVLPAGNPCTRCGGSGTEP
jgi:hypothetical protein